MPTYDLTVNQGDQPGVAAPPVAMRFERVVDFSAQNVLATDLIDIFDLPGDIKVIAASMKVITAEGGTAVIDMGISGVAADTLIDGANINAAAGTVYHSGDGTNDSLMAADGYKVPSAGAIVQLDPANDLDTAVIKVQVIALDLRDTVDSPVS